MSSAVRLWRTAFLTLRDETFVSPPCSTVLRLLDQLIFSQFDSLIAAAADLPPREVTSDLILLMELASNIFRSGETQDLTPTFTKLSHLFHTVTYCAFLDFDSKSRILVLDTFGRILELFLGKREFRNALIVNVAVIKATKQCLESIRHLFGQRQNNASVSENEKLLNFLLRVVGYFHGHSISSSYFVNDHEVPTCKIVRETLTVAFSMISEVFSGIASCLHVGVWQSTVEVLNMFMDISASKGLLVEDKTTSDLYVEIFNCLHLALSNPRGSLTAHVAGLVAALKIFFSYGHVSKSFAENQPTNHKDFVSKSTNSQLDVSSKSAHGPYRPPHLRKKAVKNLQHENSVDAPEDNSSKPYFASSDSDSNDKGGSAKESYSVFAKARLGAIICIQDLCRADPKSFTGQWAMLLPSSDIFHRKYETTLMSCLLFDPYLKVRIAAGSTIMAMLDGPASVSLQLAEYKGPSKCGSFTALSNSLGSILMQLHAGTLHLIKHETHSRLLELSFKILMLLLSSTPYSRMSEELLWTVIFSIQSRIVESLSHSDGSTLLELAISCLTKALSVSPSSIHVNDILQVEMSTGILEGQRKSGILYTLFRYCGQVSNPSLSLEAFQALRALAHNYPKITALCWDDISTIVYGVLCLHPEVSTKSWSNVDHTVSAMKEKVMTASIKVLDDCLRAISGFKGAEDVMNDKSLDNPFTSDYVKTKTVSSAPSFSFGSSMATQDECNMTCLATDRWLEVLARHMPLIITHPSPMIRAASVMCFAGITSSVFFTFDEDKQHFITSSSIDAATSGAPVVRSAACRAIGVVGCFSQIYYKTEILGKFIHAIQHNAHDPLISVRITASWALANICDSLSNFMNAPDIGRARESSEIISLLANCGLQLINDNDKVKANAVRALGNLSRFVPFTNQPFAHGEPRVDMCSNSETYGTKQLNDHLQSRSEPSEHSEWLGKMVQAFLSCLATGNVKVQWNVCHALSNLFCNGTLKLQDQDWASSIFSILLLLLRDSSNFKIRIQAAAALAVPENIDDYGRSFYDIIKGVMHIVENFNSNQISDPSNFKYWIALEKQLTSTMLHLLDLSAKCHQQTVQDLLTKKSSFLEAWIKGLLPSLGGKPGEPEKTVTSVDQKKEILSGTIQSMIQVYERGNRHPIAQRFHKLFNTLQI